MAAGLGLTSPAAAALRSPLPVIEIDTRRAIRDDPKVAGRIRILERGRPVVGARMGIEVRGHSSQLFPKKQYSVELRAARSLLGMPADDDWVLAAPYSDKSLIRNALAFHLARWTGRYAPRTRFVELVRNGRHQGVYALTERLELGAERIDAGDDGRLLELTFPFQARGEAGAFRTPRLKRPILFADPDRDDLSSREARATRGAVGRLERALYAGGGRAYRDLLDRPAAVDYVILQELLKNEDAFHGSTYFHWAAGGRVVLGPVWDFDVAMGNSDYGPSRRLRGWMTRERDWAERLWADRAFRRDVRRRWAELRRAGLRREVLGTVDAMSARLARGPAGRNFRRWPILGRRVWPNPRDPRTGGYRTTWTAETAFLRSWLDRRIAWLDRAL